MDSLAKLPTSLKPKAKSHQKRAFYSSPGGIKAKNCLMKNEDVVAVAVAVDEPVSAEVLVNATNQRDSIVSSPVDEDGILALLNQHQWPLGLQQTFISNASHVGFRYFIIDDSGSMNTPDGKLPYSNSRAPVTRWDELRESMKWHVDAIRASNLPSEFRFLNGSEPIRLGGGYDRDGAGYATIETVFEEGPRGTTPLCHHVKEVIKDIKKHERELRAKRQLAVIMIATDGLSSDGDLVQAMKPLERLPVWVVVKLCTDDDKVVGFWNEIDAQLELDIEVLDDFDSEAIEVMEHNSFLTYGLPLHRLREHGLVKKEFDLLDEAPLTLEQMRTVVQCVLGGPPSSYPRPTTDFKGFYTAVQAANATNDKVRDPARRNSWQRWIDERRLWNMYAPAKGCSIS